MAYIQKKKSPYIVPVMINIEKIGTVLIYRKDLTLTKVNGPNCLQTIKKTTTERSCRTPYITINVPLFKKMRDIIFILWDNNFLSRFEGHFEGTKTFLTP